MVLKSNKFHKGIKDKTNQNEFHKIMIAHSFTWVAFQSMFILSGFFIENKIFPNCFDFIFEETDPKLLLVFEFILNTE